MKSLTKPLAKAGVLGALLAGSPVDALVDPFFQPFHDSFFAIRPHSEGIGSSVTMYEKDDKVYVEAPLPGVDEDHIEITLEKGVLAITGKRSTKDEDEDTRYYYRSSDHFSYRVVLPEMVDLSEPEATFKNGLMQVVFEKNSSSEPRKIKFQS